MGNVEFKDKILYKIVYVDNDITKSPKGNIIGYDNNFTQIKFPDGIVKAIQNKNIISITEVYND